MTDHDQVIQDAHLNIDVKEKQDIGRTVAYGVLAASTVMLANGLSRAQAQTALTDIEILNFFLNLEYMQAQYYSVAATGARLPSADTAGVGTGGAITGGRAVSFADPLIGQFAREVAAADLAHVRYIREQLIIAGGLAVTQPAIDFTGGFASAMQAAGIGSFDPFANDDNFLLSAFFFQDFAVSAYKGVSALITNKTYLEGLMGIMATKAHHAAFVRMTLLQKGIANPALITAANAISDVRDSLDGSADLDQGIAPRGAVSNIAPADSNGVGLGRTPGQSMNIVYLQRASVSAGGFFPSGLNGTVRTSAAS